MGDWTQSRAKARLDHRERIDELIARTRFEVRLHLNEPGKTSGYDELTDIFAIGHTECTELLSHHRLLPVWERWLLARFTHRLHGKAITRSVGAVPPGAPPSLARAFGAEITELAPASGDTSPAYDLQGRGLLTVFRIAVGAKGEIWPERHEVATTSARNVLTCATVFARRKPWHVLWPVYRVRGLRLWKL